METHMAKLVSEFPPPGDEPSPALDGSVPVPVTFLVCVAFAAVRVANRYPPGEGTTLVLIAVWISLAVSLSTDGLNQ